MDIPEAYFLADPVPFSADHRWYIRSYTDRSALMNADDSQTPESPFEGSTTPVDQMPHSSDIPMIQSPVLRFFLIHSVPDEYRFHVVKASQKMNQYQGEKNP